MKDIIKSGDALIMEGKPYVPLDMYKNLQKDLKRKNSMIDILIEELECQKTVIENKKQMRILKQ